MLAESIEIGPGGALNRDVGYFKLTRASIVNGTQTVVTLGSILGTDDEPNLGRAFVLVRCIEVTRDEEDLGRRITRYANTQNEVSTKDLRSSPSAASAATRAPSSRHRVHPAVGRDAKVEGSHESDRGSTSCRGLACASPNIGHAVITKRQVSRLFSDSSVHPALFNPQTDPLRLSRAVTIVGRIDELLDVIEREKDGVEAGVAVHGRRVIAHLAVRRIGETALKDPATDLGDLLADLDSEVAEYVEGLTGVFPENAYRGNVFKNQTRVAELLTAADLTA